MKHEIVTERPLIQKLGAMKLTEKLRAAAASTQLRASVRALLQEAADDLEDHNRTFDQRWKADMHAIKRWRAEHPRNDLVWPGHTDLVIWLLEQKSGVTKTSG